MRRCIAMVALLALLPGCATVRDHRRTSIGVGVTAFITAGVGAPLIATCVPNSPEECGASYDAQVLGYSALIGAAVSTLIAYELRGETKREPRRESMRWTLPPPSIARPAPWDEPTIRETLATGDGELVISFGGDDDVRNGAAARASTPHEACALAKRAAADSARLACEPLSAGTGAIAGARDACHCLLDADGAVCTTHADARCVDDPADSVALGAGAGRLAATATTAAVEDARAECGRYSLSATVGAPTCACDDDGCTCVLVAPCD